jgi:excisionase family DNA binding protein
MSNDLLPKVELWQLSEPAIRALKDVVRLVLDERGISTKPPIGALRAAQAATYIGVGRSKFYQLLRTEPQLQASSFRAGTARLWRKEDLDTWMQAQIGSNRYA